MKRLFSYMENFVDHRVYLIRILKASILFLGLFLMLFVGLAISLSITSFFPQSALPLIALLTPIAFIIYLCWLKSMFLIVKTLRSRSPL